MPPRRPALKEPVVRGVPIAPQQIRNLSLLQHPFQQMRLHLGLDTGDPHEVLQKRLVRIDRREFADRLLVHQAFLLTLQRPDLLLHPLYPRRRIADLHRQLHPIALPRLHCHHPPPRALERLGVRIVRSRLQTGDVPVPLRGGVLPLRKSRQLVLVEAQHQPPVPLPVAQHRQRAAVLFRQQIVPVHLLHVPRRRPQVGVVPVESLHRARIARRHHARRRHQLRPLVQKGRTEVAVVEQLHLRPDAAQIGHLIDDRHPVRTNFRRHLRHQLVSRTEQPGLVHLADHHQFRHLSVRCITGNHLHLHPRGGQIADLPVQRQLHLGRHPHVVRHHVGARRPGRVEPAARDRLVEAGQKTQPPALLQIDELRMHRPPHRRIPADRQPSVRPLPDRHSPRRQHGKGEGAVVHLDDLHPVAQPAPQRALANRPSLSQPQFLTADSKTLLPDPLLGVSQHPRFDVRHIELSYLTTARLANKRKYRAL